MHFGVHPFAIAMTARACPAVLRTWNALCRFYIAMAILINLRSATLINHRSSSNYRTELIYPTDLSDHIDLYSKRVHQVAKRKSTCEHARPVMDDGTFAAALTCMRLTHPELELEYPSDAEEHVLEIRRTMAPWAHHGGHRFHEAIGFAGPWI